VHVKELVPGLWPRGVETTEKIEEVVRFPERRWRGRGGGGVEVGKWCSLATLDIIGFPTSATNSVRWRVLPKRE